MRWRLRALITPKPACIPVFSSRQRGSASSIRRSFWRAPECLVSPLPGSEEHTFANQNVFQTPVGSFSPQRGYVLIDATLDGVPIEFVSTHLDETHSPAQ